MDLRTYQIESAKTALGGTQEYFMLGIFGELGELAEKVKKVIRDKDGIYDEETLHLLHLDLGDICWYVAQYAAVRSVVLEDCKLDGFSIIENNLPAVLIQLGVNVGDMLSFRLHEASGEHMYRIGKVIRSLGGIAHLLGTRLEDILDMNIEKTHSRLARNVLHGNGDER